MRLVSFVPRQAIQYCKLRAWFQFTRNICTCQRILCLPHSQALDGLGTRLRIRVLSPTSYSTAHTQWIIILDLQIVYTPIQFYISRKIQREPQLSHTGRFSPPDSLEGVTTTVITYIVVTVKWVSDFEAANDYLHCNVHGYREGLHWACTT